MIMGLFSFIISAIPKNNIRKGNMEYNRCYSCYFNSYFFIERKR